MNEIFIESNGLRFHALTAGPAGGPLALLLHGFPQNAHCWRKQIPALAQAGYRVLALDQRGYATSDKPKGVGAYAIPHLVDDLAAVIRTQGNGRAFVVGHDWGGIPVWTLLERHPELVEKAVILCSPHPTAWRKQVLSSPEQMRRSWYVLLFQLPWLPERMLARNDYAGMQQSLTRTSKPGTFSDADIAQYKQAWDVPGALTSMLNWYRAIVRHPLASSSVPKKLPPALLLWGKRDKFLGTSLAEASLAYHPGMRLEVLPGSHWLPEEMPDEVNAHLLSFFGAPAYS